jgi:hypothetical protein
VCDNRDGFYPTDDNENGGIIMNRYRVKSKITYQHKRYNVGDIIETTEDLGRYNSYLVEVGKESESASVKVDEPAKVTPPAKATTTAKTTTAKKTKTIEIEVPDEDEEEE